MTSSILIRFEEATLVRPTGEPALTQLSWMIRQGECWSIVGSAGSGKTTLTEAVLGRFRLVAGRAEWPILQQTGPNTRPVTRASDAFVRVAFKEESRHFSYSRHYAQQRFNFIEPEDDLKVGDYLRHGTGATEAEVQQAANELGIGDRLAQSFIALSNGQARRARIARALLTRPEFLILDEPFSGLDRSGRIELAAILDSLLQRGTRLMLVVPLADLPACVTHVIHLDSGRVRYAGPRDRLVSPPDTRRMSAMITPGRQALGDPIIEMDAVQVSYSGRPILQDVSWTVHAGERWAIQGPNGAGKTTLLSLICGDHPQAYSNSIRLFGRQRGTGESIWEVKRRIGYFSPELHLYFNEPLTADRAAATGFYDVLVSRATSSEQDNRILELFSHFGAEDWRLRPFARLSTGQQRVVLLIRALVKDVPLLILDEPFQVLDERTRELARSWIDERLTPNQSVLFVTHDERELPATIRHRLILQEGRVAEYHREVGV